jgi:hypothetical protein
MSFSYLSGGNLQIDAVRALIRDTNPLKPVWSDEEILMFYQIQAAQFQSGMFYSAPAGRNLPSSPVSYLRVAALLLDAWSTDNAKLAIIQDLDIRLAPAQAAKSLQDLADKYREIDDNAGAFAIIEQATTNWAYEQRFWNQVQRQLGGGGS